MDKQELQDEAGRLGLDTAGTKTELQKRISAHRAGTDLVEATWLGPDRRFPKIGIVRTGDTIRVPAHNLTSPLLEPTAGTDNTN